MMQAPKAIAFALAAVALASLGWASGVDECNDTLCFVKKVVVRSTINCPDYHYQTTFTCEHYLNPKVPGFPPDCVILNDGYDSNCYFTYVVENITWIPVCGYVVAITGLPPVVCVGETYTLTAVSNGPPLSQGVIWSGNGSILSQIGSTALVSFPSTGSNLVMYAQAAQGQATPAAQTSTTAASVSYSLPARDGNPNVPASVPCNAEVNMNVTISPTLPAGKSLAFKIVGGSSANGKASITSPQSKSLSGAGGVLRLRGDVQTVPGNAGALHVSTDTAPYSSCGPSAGFSVCAHPNRITWSYLNAINGELSSTPQGIGRYWGSRYAGIFSSDSGALGDLSQVKVSEFVTVNSGTGIFVGSTSHVSSWQLLLPVSGPSVKIDGISTGGINFAVGAPVSATDFNALVDSKGISSRETSTQILRFSCARCGIPELSTSPAIPESGVIHQIYTTPPSGASVYNVVVEKNPDGSAGATASTVVNAGPHSTPIQ